MALQWTSEIDRADLSMFPQNVPAGRPLASRNAKEMNIRFTGSRAKLSGIDCKICRNGCRLVVRAPSAWATVTRISSESVAPALVYVIPANHEHDGVPLRNTMGKIMTNGYARMDCRKVTCPIRRTTGSIWKRSTRTSKSTGTKSLGKQKHVSYCPTVAYLFPPK